MVCFRILIYFLCIRKGCCFFICQFLCCYNSGICISDGIDVIVQISEIFIGDRSLQCIFIGKEIRTAFQVFCFFICLNRCFEVLLCLEFVCLGIAIFGSSIVFCIRSFLFCFLCVPKRSDRLYEGIIFCLYLILYFL